MHVCRFVHDMHDKGGFITLFSGSLSARFFSRESGQFKFQLENAAVRIPTGSQASNRRLVAFIFHPSEPFVISIQKALYDYVVSFHFRNCFT